MKYRAGALGLALLTASYVGAEQPVSPAHKEGFPEKGYEIAQDISNGGMTLEQVLADPPDDPVNLSEVSEVIKLEGILPPGYNYFQGYNAILIQDSEGNEKSIAFFGNIGDCCPWPEVTVPESSAVLVYPFENSEGITPQPYWVILNYPNERNTDMSLDEHELFTTAPHFDGELWHMMYSGTRLRTINQNNRARLGMFATTNPFVQNPPNVRYHAWLPPVTPGCREEGSCEGNGSGWHPTFLELEEEKFGLSPGLYLFVGENISYLDGSRYVKNSNILYRINDWHGDDKVTLLAPVENEDGTWTRIEYHGHRWSIPRDIGIHTDDGGEVLQSYGYTNGPVTNVEAIRISESEDALNWYDVGKLYWDESPIWDPARLKTLDGKFADSTLMIMNYSYGSTVIDDWRVVLFVDKDAKIPKSLRENWAPLLPEQFQKTKPFRVDMGIRAAATSPDNEDPYARVFLNNQLLDIVPFRFTGHMTYRLNFEVDPFKKFHTIQIQRDTECLDCDVYMSRTDVNFRAIDFDDMETDKDVTLVHDNYFDIDVLKLDWGANIIMNIPTEKFLPRTPGTRRSGRISSY